jgi:hypothetical protein
VRFACKACGVVDAIELPRDPTAPVACATCGARQARRDLDVARLQDRFVSAGQRSAQAKAELARQQASDAQEAATARCPACGDDLFTVEYGCPKCGAGKKPLLARGAWSYPAIAFLVPLAAGLAAFAAFGTAPRSGPIANVAFILGGSFAVALGVWVITKPGDITMVKSYGTDAGGTPMYGSSYVASSEQRLRFGAIWVAVGLAVVLLGVFFGLLAA